MSKNIYRSASNEWLNNVLGKSEGTIKEIIVELKRRDKKNAKKHQKLYK